jgi:dolichol kinase
MASLILRKAWRLSGIIFPLIYYFSNKITTIFIIVPFLCIFIVIEILRFYLFRFNERLFNIFRYILEEKERKSLLTTTWFLLSTFLTVALFRKEIAIMAVLFLIFGDSASSFFGLRFGRTKIMGNRSLEGSLAFFITCLMVGIIMHFTKVSLSWLVIILGALAATLAELLSLSLDDNFTIALFSGIIMTIVSKLIG